MWYLYMFMIIFSLFLLCLLICLIGVYINDCRWQLKYSKEFSVKFREFDKIYRKKYMSGLATTTPSEYKERLVFEGMCSSKYNTESYNKRKRISGIIVCGVAVSFLLITIVSINCHYHRIGNIKQEEKLVCIPLDYNTMRIRTSNKNIEVIEEEPILMDNMYTSTFDITTPSNLSSETLSHALDKYPYNNLLPYVDVIIKAEEEYGINALYLVSKFGFESGWGRSKANTNNIAGWRKGDGWESFDSVEECIMLTAERIKNNYIPETGSTIEAVSNKYCPNSPTYIDTLIKIMEQRENAILKEV